MKLGSVFPVLCTGLSLAFGQWEDPVRLTVDDSSSHTSFNNVHCLAAAEGNVLHLAWYDRRLGPDQVLYKRSTDNGTTWSLDTVLTSGPGRKTDPCVAVSGSAVHIIWEDGRSGYSSQVYYRRSTDSGATWETEMRINYDDYQSRNPCVSAQGDLVHLVWASDSAGRELYYMRSTDRGATWGGRRRLTFDIQESWNPSLAVSDSIVHVAWRDWRDHSFEVYYLRSIDYGATWDTTPVRLSGDLANGSYNPCLAASGSAVHVAWWDCQISPFELYYRRSLDYGRTWEPETRLTTDTTGTYNQSIAAQGDNVYVAWEALYNTSFIMYKQSTDLGATWSVDTALTTAPQFWSCAPCVAVRGDAVHIVWTEFRDSEQGEIYYMRNLHGTGIGEPGGAHSGGRAMKSAIVHGVLWLPTSSIRPQASSCLLDATGRKVQNLESGPNDVSRLASGVYFVSDRSQSGGQGASPRKVIIQH